jgi:hypothetical protein
MAIEVFILIASRKSKRDRRGDKEWEFSIKDIIISYLKDVYHTEIDLELIFGEIIMVWLLLNKTL